MLKLKYFINSLYVFNFLFFFMYSNKIEIKFKSWIYYNIIITIFKFNIFYIKYNILKYMEITYISYKSHKLEIAIN